MQEIIDKCVSILSEMHAETKYSAIPLDVDRLSAFLKDHIEGCQFLYLDDDAIMLGRCFAPFFSTSTVASDIVIYVRKGARGNGVAERMIKLFTQWANHHGAVQITIGQSSGVEKESFKRLAEKLGATECGVSYEVKYV